MFFLLISPFSAVSFEGIIPLDYGQSGCSDYVVLQEFDLGEPLPTCFPYKTVDQILFPFNLYHSLFTVHMPDGVSFVDAAGCVGDAVKAYIALHYMGHLGGPDDTGKILSLF